MCAGALLAAPALGAADPGAPDLSGRWAQLQVTTSVADLPIIGDVTSTTTSVLVLDVTQSGSTLVLTEQVCSIDLSSTSKRVRTLFPKAFTRAVSGRVKRAHLTRDGSTIRFTQKRDYAFLGAKLKRSGSLPDEPDDPRVFDQDGDGHPGVTVRIRGAVDGDIYVVQRSWDEMYGELLDEDHFDGHVKWKTEQSVLGATSIFLKSSPDSRAHASPARNYFRTTRLPQGKGCAHALKHRDTLFQR
ncbi:MAG: hypothetical protein AAGI01_15525 [Myxococcota bacterium]